MLMFFPTSNSDSRRFGCLGLLAHLVIYLLIICVGVILFGSFMDWHYESNICTYCERYTGTYAQFLGERLQYIWNEIILKLF